MAPSPSDARAGAQLAHDGFHQAPLRQRALQQVDADERGKRQEPLADVDRAAGNALRQRQQDEAAGDETNELP
jgi:hypothetical protein